MSDISPELRIRAQKTDSGIPEEMKDKILQPFFKAKKVTEKTGLELSITHDISKAHGGQLEINSNERGSVFRIKLPYK